MAFRLSQIDFTADGRRIERAREVAASELTIGRDSACDIHLADLAVEPRHVGLREVGGKIEVTALGSLGFTLDGASRSQALIDPASGGELRLGAARIGIGRADDGTVLLRIEASNGASAPADPLEDKRGFSLAAVLPGRRLAGWIMALAILLGFLAFPIVSHLTRAPQGHVMGDKAWNPGPLSRGHHQLAGKCEACHVRPFEAVKNETCSGCHKQIHDHAAPTRLASARANAGPGEAALWGVAHLFGKQGPGACVDCHVEHKGGTGSPAESQALCADCHVGLKNRLPDTKLGDAGDFGTLHPELLVSVVTNADNGARARLPASQHPREDNGLSFSHKVHVDARGGVARMAMELGSGAGYGKPLGCANCHHQADDGVRFTKLDMAKDCQACHSLAYDRVGTTVRKLRHGDVAQMFADLSVAGPRHPLVTGRQRPGAYADGQPYAVHFATPMPSPGAAALGKNGICGECHTATIRNGHPTVRPVFEPTRYYQNGWFDHSAHKDSKCEDCHAARTSNSAADVLIPPLANCRQCHVGETATTSSNKVPSSCAMCHVYHESALPPPGRKAVRPKA